jgi:hypothetical protein
MTQVHGVVPSRDYYGWLLFLLLILLLPVFGGIQAMLASAHA